MSLKLAVDLFFREPDVPSVARGVNSILHLLRQDICICLGFEPSTNQQLSHKALWPATMAMLAGIDLLGKFLSGNDSTGKVGKRFKGFIDKYFPTASPKDSEIIYQFRNAMLHSFGLYSKDRQGTEYRFSLIPNGKKLITNNGNNQYMISILHLYTAFNDAIRKYKKDLGTDLTLQEAFNNVFPTYGTIVVH